MLPISRLDKLQDFREVVTPLKYEGVDSAQLCMTSSLQPSSREAHAERAHAPESARAKTRRSLQERYVFNDQITDFGGIKEVAYTVQSYRADLLLHLAHDANHAWREERRLPPWSGKPFSVPWQASRI